MPIGEIPRVRDSSRLDQLLAVTADEGLVTLENERLMLAARTLLDQCAQAVFTSRQIGSMVCPGAVDRRCGTKPHDSVQNLALA